MPTREPILVDGVIDGRLAAREVRDQTRVQVEALRAMGIAPCVVFVRVGDDPASEVYVNAKERACRRMGLTSAHLHLPASTSWDALVARVAELNADPEVDAILIQLPLPEGLGPHARDILNHVDPHKDVDGFHPLNLGALLGGHGPLQPCTPAGVMRLMARMGLSLRGRHAVVVGRSVIVGRPMAALLVRAGATVTHCHRHTVELRQHIERADVLITATGVPGLIPGAWVKPGAYVFDVGITRMEDGTLRGDVCYEEALGRAAGITPVPGGVGPMTIAMLLENTVRCARIRRGLDTLTIHRA